MNIEVILQPSEIQELAQCLKKRRDGPHVQNFERLLTSWKNAVVEVEHGYKCSVFELQQDLGSRCNLEDAIARTTPAIAEKVREWLDPIDARYRAATIESTSSLTGRDTPRTHWWCFRIPLRASIEFKAELRNHGF